jgi:hypothetical protein
MGHQNSNLFKVSGIAMLTRELDVHWFLMDRIFLVSFGSDLAGFKGSDFPGFKGLDFSGFFKGSGQVFKGLDSGTVKNRAQFS